MLATDLMLDLCGRNAELVPVILEGLSAEQVCRQPGPQANSLGWLLWHAARVEDDHLAGIAGTQQVWPFFEQRFGLPYGDAHGFGMSAEDVAKFSIEDPQVLADYYAAVHKRTVEVVEALSESDFGHVVDESYDPPVTTAVRLVSVINDITQHVGQAAYVRGLVERADGQESGFTGYAG